jgi:hypothetical protein
MWPFAVLSLVRAGRVPDHAASFLLIDQPPLLQPDYYVATFH